MGIQMLLSMGELDGLDQVRTSLMSMKHIYHSIFAPEYACLVITIITKVTS